MEYAELRTNVLLSIQRALLGMIYPEIRAISVGFEGLKKLKIIYYLDRHPNDDDYDNISDVAGEVLADINFFEVEELCVHSNEILSKLKCLDSWVYIRKEI